MKTFFSIKKKINTNIFFKSNYIFKHNMLLSIQKYNFARKSIYSNKLNVNNSLNEESNNPEDIINEEFYENNNFNNPNLNIEDESSLEYKLNTMKNLDKSLKRKTFLSNPSLNVNKNKDLLNQIDQKELKIEEKRINKILKKLDSVEFDDFITKKISKGLNEKDIYNELFGDNDKSKKVSFNDLDNLMSIGEKETKSKRGKKPNTDKNVIDIESVENANETEYNKEDDMKNRLSSLKKELNKKKKTQDEIGPEVNLYKN